MPMIPYNVPVGTKISEIEPRPRWLDETLESRGFAVGDLVTYSLGSYFTSMVIYRIVADTPPNGDAVCTEVAKRRFGSTIMKKSWTLPGKTSPLSAVKIKGSVTLEPAFTFFQGKYSPRKRTVAYRNTSMMKKLDILELAKNFSAFQDFIRVESQRLSV